MSNEESTVERMEEGDAGNAAGEHPNDNFIVDLDASALLAMDAPGGSRSPSTQAAPEASLPHDATGELVVEELGSEVEDMINNVLDPYLRRYQGPDNDMDTITDTVAATSKEEERSKRKEERRKKGGGRPKEGAEDGRRKAGRETRR